MRKAWFLAAVASCVFTAAASPAEVYVVQGRALGVGSVGGNILWSTDVLFYNGGATSATVQFLGASNGPAGPSPASFLIPPGRSAALTRIAPSWQPGTFDPLWVVRLHVPDEVALESVLFIGTQSAPAGAPPVVRPQRYGKVRLPVVRALAPANQAQVHLATWLGDPSEIPSRLNVGIFNAGAVAANAHVQVRQACDERVIDERTITVPPNTLVQTNGLRTAEDACPETTGGTVGGTHADIYTVITVDQPSLTFVSNLANNAIPTTSISIN